MLNILISSEDPERLATVTRLVNDSAGYSPHPLTASPAQLLGAAHVLDGYDVLIVDLPHAAPEAVLDIHSLCRLHPGVTCLLATSEPTSELLISAMRAGVRDVLAWPIDQDTLAQALARAAQQHAAEAHHTTQVISFLSCKGGAGTTLLAGNVSWLIGATQGKRVLLIDLAQEFGDAAFLVSEKVPPATLPEVSAQAERIDASFLDTCVMHVDETFDVLAGAGDPIRASQVTEASMKLILTAASLRYDVIVFDLGQLINPLSVFAMDHSDRICVVVQASMPYLRAGKRLLEIVRSLGTPMDRIDLVLNRSSRHDSVQSAELYKVFGMRPVVTLPGDYDSVCEATNQGVPVAKLFRRSAIARGLSALADELVRPRDGAAQASPAQGSSVFGKLFGSKPKTGGHGHSRLA